MTKKWSVCFFNVHFWTAPLKEESQFLICTPLCIFNSDSHDLFLFVESWNGRYSRAKSNLMDLHLEKKKTTNSIDTRRYKIIAWTTFEGIESETIRPSSRKDRQALLRMSDLNFRAHSVIFCPCHRRLWGREWISFWHAGQFLRGPRHDYLLPLNFSTRVAKNSVFMAKLRRAVWFASQNLKVPAPKWMSCN